MRLSLCRWLIPAALVVAGSLPLAAADQPARSLVAIDVPVTGGLGSTSAAVYESLRAGGQYDLWWVKVFEPPHTGRSIASIVINNSSPRTPEIKDLASYVTNGGGLVLLAGASAQWRKDNRSLLSALDVQISDVKNQSGQITVKHQSVTEGLSNGTLHPIGAGLQSGVLDPIIEQGDQPVALAGIVGKGRVVVILAPLVTASDPQAVPEPERVRLLSQALQWTAQGLGAVEGAGTILGPGTPSAQPRPPTDLAAKVVADLPTDEPWKEIVAAVQQGVEALGLPLEPVAYKKGTRDLRQAVADRPALLIISSYRDFDDAESAAVAEYVAGGGSLLALGYGRADSIQTLTAFNRLLGEFGVSITFGRPAGKAALCTHPAAQGLAPLAKAPAGCGIWAFGDWPLATVDDECLATAHEVDRGRLIVMDAATLMRPMDKGKPAVEDTSAGFRRLLEAEMRWLTGK